VTESCEPGSGSDVISWGGELAEQPRSNMSSIGPQNVAANATIKQTDAEHTNGEIEGQISGRELNSLATAWQGCPHWYRVPVQRRVYEAPNTAGHQIVLHSSLPWCWVPKWSGLWPRYLATRRPSAPSWCRSGTLLRRPIRHPLVLGLDQTQAKAPKFAVPCSAGVDVAKEQDSPSRISVALTEPFHIKAPRISMI
jgi:hypothetical protein